MALLKTVEEISRMREGGRLLAQILDQVIAAVKPGVSTLDLNALAHDLMLKAGAEPLFLGYQGYPGVICASVNEQVVHAIPYAEKVLNNGDIIGVDIGIRYQGMCTDMARTVGVGQISAEAKKLMDVTRESLLKGLAQVKAGNRIGDISEAVQRHAEAAGYSLVRSLFGHGVGHEMHEDPRIPNFGKAGTGPTLQAGMTIAIEPMVNVGTSDVVIADDGWSIATADGLLSAHFEDTVEVTAQGYRLLTDPKP